MIMFSYKKKMALLYESFKYVTYQSVNSNTVISSLDLLKIENSSIFDVNELLYNIFYSNKNINGPVMNIIRMIYEKFSMGKNHLVQFIDNLKNIFKYILNHDDNYINYINEDISDIFGTELFHISKFNLKYSDLCKKILDYSNNNYVQYVNLDTSIKKLSSTGEISVHLASDMYTIINFPILITIGNQQLLYIRRKELENFIKLDLDYTITNIYYNSTGDIIFMRDMHNNFYVSTEYKLMDIENNNNVDVAHNIEILNKKIFFIKNDRFKLATQDSSNEYNNISKCYIYIEITDGEKKIGYIYTNRQKINGLEIINTKIFNENIIDIFIYSSIINTLYILTEKHFYVYKIITTSYSEHANIIEKISIDNILYEKIKQVWVYCNIIYILLKNGRVFVRYVNHDDNKIDIFDIESSNCTIKKNFVPLKDLIDILYKHSEIKNKQIYKKIITELNNIKKIQSNGYNIFILTDNILVSASYTKDIKNCHNGLGHASLDIINVRKIYGKILDISCTSNCTVLLTDQLLILLCGYNIFSKSEIIYNDFRIVMDVTSSMKTHGIDLRQYGANKNNTHYIKYIKYKQKYLFAKKYLINKY